MAKKDKSDLNTIVVNRKASFKYELMQRFEAGIVLVGSEVKSLREKKANLTDSYVLIKRGEAWLINAHISKYTYANILNHEPIRDRKLLLKKKEIRKLTGQLTEKGLTLVPLRLYFKDGRAKTELALAKGKKLFDKRESIKKRETDRAMERMAKSRK